MSGNKTDAFKNWLITITVIFNLSLVLIFLGFSKSQESEGTSNHQKIESRNQALSTTAIAFVGLVLMINAYYAAKRAAALQKSAIAAEKSNKIGLQNAKIFQERLIAERFMGAIAQLGHDKVETRTGAIYALERVAQDCPKEYWTIMEILTAFVRENTFNQAESEEETEENTAATIFAPMTNAASDTNWREEPPKIRTDIQVALTVIGRRDSQKDPENQKLDLRNTDIRGADLRDANLQRADLRGSDLSGADLRRIDLSGADLDGGKLSGSILYEANLQGCNLHAANLTGANLNRTNLQSSNLRAANLTGASLRAANMTGANLYKANLYQANLKVANLQGAKLFLANLQGAKLGKANLRLCGLIGANLQQANLNGANLTGANLNAAKLQHTEVLFANLSETSLTEADLSGANLMGTNLQKAVLYEANLCGANLMGANLSETNLCDVKLERAILTGAKNLQPQQIIVALGDRTTRLPENVETPTHWRQSS
ncbi:MAG: pentapeptide repeat-containing protein [Heteroscytonema crispum UTEX LB 1556]